MNIYSTGLNNGYATASGTSFSAPQVTGTVALMLSVSPTLTPNQIKTILHNTSTPLAGYTYNASGWNNEVGYGMLDVHAALAAVVPCNIQGPSVVEGNATYTLNGIPSGYDIVWSINNNQISIASSGNQCTVTYNLPNPSDYATLCASVKKNGKTIRVVEKQIIAVVGFTGTYNYGTGIKQINYPNPLWVPLGSVVTITSPLLVNATVSYTGNATPTYNLFYPSIGQLNVGMPSNNYVTIIANITTSFGHTYLLPIISTSNPPQLNVSATNGQLSVSLVNRDIIEDGSLLQEYATDIDLWSLEVYNVVTGEKKCGVIVHDTSYSIPTTGWKSGIYSVRATIGDERLCEKITIK